MQKQLLQQVLIQLTSGYEMEPMEDVDESGLGHYILKDGMKAYCKKMLEDINL